MQKLKLAFKKCFFWLAPPFTGVRGEPGSLRALRQLGKEELLLEILRGSDLDPRCETSVVGDYLKHDGHVVSVGTSYVIQGQVSCEPFALRLGLGTLDVGSNIVSVPSTQVRPKSAMLATSDRYTHH